MVEQILAGGSVAITATIGLLTYLRGRHVDRTLDVSANVQAAFDAQATHIEALQEDIATQRSWLHDCEQACRELRRKVAELDRVERELANLKVVCFDQEQTIARHERTLNAVSRRGDHPPPAWEGDERRNPPEDPDEPADP